MNIVKRWNLAKSNPTQKEEATKFEIEPCPELHPVFVLSVCQCKIAKSVCSFVWFLFYIRWMCRDELHALSLALMPEKPMVQHTYRGVGTVDLLLHYRYVTVS